jgi:hypothetical protein
LFSCSVVWLSVVIVVAVVNDSRHPVLTRLHETRPHVMNKPVRNDGVVAVVVVVGGRETHTCKSEGGGGQYQIIPDGLVAGGPRALLHAHEAKTHERETKENHTTPPVV